MSTLVDSYSESNYAGAAYSSYTGSSYLVGQSFTAIAGNLASCKFYLGKSGSPTGNVVAHLYAHTGTFGVDGQPSGSALATSGGVDVSTFTNYAIHPDLIEFTFSGANQYALVNGTKYFITTDYNLGDSSNFVAVGRDQSTLTHAGNTATSSDGSNWSATSAVDLPFYVYADVGGATVRVGSLLAMFQ